MTARILVVDDIPANVKLLEVRLRAEYFEVLTAHGGAEALEQCENGAVDVVLLDVMMPEMDGFEVCRRLKADPATAHIPVVMVTALDQASDRVRGLQAGADDFLTKPVDDLQLMTRVKNLVRLKSLTDELRLRAATTRDIGIAAMLRGAEETDGRPLALLVEPDAAAARRFRRLVGAACDVEVVADPQAALFFAAEKGCDCVVVATGPSEHDPLRVVSQLRALERTRFVPIMLIVGEGEEGRILRGLELGINDYLVRPLDGNELVVRLRGQFRRKRYNDALRASVSQTLEFAVTDPLTGLHNRAYLDTHLKALVARAADRGTALSVMIADIDRFKAINDMHGHDAGDAVLREFAARLRARIRGIDLVCRYGGEEFVVVMPETPAGLAGIVAERVRGAVAERPFPLPGGGEIAVTVSLGVASLAPPGDAVAALMKRADSALYEAKNGGRNRVVAAAA